MKIKASVNTRPLLSGKKKFFFEAKKRLFASYYLSTLSELRIFYLLKIYMANDITNHSINS